MNNPYVRYYLDQQQGRDMPVFGGSPWQYGYGQMVYGLGGLYRSGDAHGEKRSKRSWKHCSEKWR